MNRCEQAICVVRVKVERHESETTAMAVRRSHACTERHCVRPPGQNILERRASAGVSCFQPRIRVDYLRAEELRAGHVDCGVAHRRCDNYVHNDAMQSAASQVFTREVIDGAPRYAGVIRTKRGQNQPGSGLDS